MSRHTALPHPEFDRLVAHITRFHMATVNDKSCWETVTRVFMFALVVTIIMPAVNLLAPLTTKSTPNAKSKAWCATDTFQKQAEVFLLY